MYNQIAMVGPADVIKPLKAIGFNVFAADEANAFDDAVSILLKEKNCGLVFLDEHLAQNYPASYERLQKNKKITITLTPTLVGKKGLFKENTAKLIKQAIGYHFAM